MIIQEGNPFVQRLSQQVWMENYKWETDETVWDTFRRVAKYVASVEKDKKYWEEKYYELLSTFKYTPGGRILSNAGTNLKGTTFLNCFVSGFRGKNQDSISSIYEELARQAKTLASEGGYGCNFDVLRPRGSFVAGIGVETSGTIQFMELWDISSSALTKGSGTSKKGTKGKNKIRKGALMGMLSLWHPAIEEFIVAKQQPGVLTKFNLTVLAPEDFIDAVKKHKPWKLRFPDTTFEKYNDEWDGDIYAWEEKNYPINIWKEYEDANELWDLIMTSTSKRNEPGIAFIDRVNELNNLSYCERINASNPSLRMGTKVLTKTGVYNIEELENKEFYVKNLNGIWSFAKCFLSGKDKPLYRISLTNGKDIYATKEHKWAVALINGGFGKVTTDNLIPGNYLPFIEEDSLKICCDNEFSYDEGFMIGWLYGDGWISDRNNKAQVGKRVYGFCFNNKEGYIAEKVLPIVNSMKTQPSNITKGNDSLFYIQITDSSFDEIMRNKYKVDKKQFGLPKSIWNSGENYIKGFVDGLFSSDGSIRITTSNKQIVLTNKYKTIVDDLSDLFGFYGIKSRISIRENSHATFPNGKTYNKVYVRHDLVVNNYHAYRFSNIFNITHTEKNIILKNIHKSYTSNNFRISEKGVVQIATIEKTLINENVWDISVFDETHCFQISSCITGNCGEQFLPIKGSCNLGSINLTQYINEKKDGFDTAALKEDIPTIVRFQDSIIDLTNYPLEEQKIEALEKRRCGIGYMGYGSGLYLLKLPYGQDAALKPTEKLIKFITNQAYQASSDLAKEKGSFPLFDCEKYLKSKFVKQALTEATIEKIRQQGLRNSHLTTVAPTGNTSLFANNCSGGLEPVVSAKYTRTIIEVSPPEDLIQPINIDWDLHTYEVENGWEWVMEGDEWILRKEYDKFSSGATKDEMDAVYEGKKNRFIVYKIDRNRGLTREEEVSDYAVLLMGQDFDEKAEYAKNIFNLTVEEHIETMKVFARYIDSSISKTINIPNNYAYEDFKNVYMQAYDSGYIKGITTYREGTMANVLSVKGSEAKYDCAEKETPERPKSVPCHIHRITVKGEKWLVFVGLDEGRPFEVFAGKVDLVDVPSSITEGSIIRLKSGVYQLEYDGEIIIKDIGKIFDSSVEEAMTRMISLHLQRRTPLYDLIDQLSKSYGTIIDFNKSITRALKKYMKDRETTDKCPTCGANLVYQEGCLSCRSCGMAKCG